MARANVRESEPDAGGIGGLISGMVQVDKAVKAGLFKRQYRDHRLEWMMKSGGEIVMAGMRDGTIRFTGP